MRHFLTILNHEIRMLLVSPGTYIAGVSFLALMGFIFAGILQDYSLAPQEVSPARIFFQRFWIPVLFMVPLLTMKSISEERRHGTLETLLTSPVTTTEVILGKYGAAYFLYLLLWGSTSAFFFILQKYAGDARFLDSGPLYGGYIFIAISGLLFIAIGILASSLSRNQAVAGLLCCMLLAILLGPSFIHDAGLFDESLLSPIKTLTEKAHILRHLDDFSRGIVDTRQILFHISGTTLALILSILALEAKLLHS
jgi:ABC-2 type transport system permease protein